MKSLLFRSCAIAAELLAGLAAVCGCSTKKETPKPDKPGEIRWRGPGTGFENTTPAPKPDDVTDHPS